MKHSKEKIREAVRQNYGKIVEENYDPGDCGCSPAVDSGCCGPVNTKTFDQVSSKLGYSAEELAIVPDSSNLGLGCGNPQAIADIKEGETVLDLGSGAGFDVFLAANQLGKTGKVIGVDMTPSMVSKARENAEKGSYINVEFRLGEIEYLPIADNSVDVIISNCVINLSPEKDKVFREAFRVLKKGGRLAISDVVNTTEFPENIKQDLSLYSACVTGASTISDLERMLREAGFEKIRIKPKDESKEFIEDWAPNRNLSDYIISATIEAVKP